MRIAGGGNARRGCRRAAWHGDGLAFLHLREVLLRELGVLLELGDLLVRDICLHVRDDIAGRDVVAVLHDEFRDRTVGFRLDVDHRARDFRVIDREAALPVLVCIDADGADDSEHDERDWAEFQCFLDFFCDIDFQIRSLLFS